jgi:hypothetical protein
MPMARKKSIIYHSAKNRTPRAFPGAGKCTLRPLAKHLNLLANIATRGKIL